MKNLKQFIPVFSVSLVINCCTSITSDTAVNFTPELQFFEYIKESKSLENIISVLNTLRPSHLKDAVVEITDIDIRDNKGFTPLMYAAGHSLKWFGAHTDLVWFLAFYCLQIATSGGRVPPTKLASVEHQFLT